MYIQRDNCWSNINESSSFPDFNFFEGKSRKMTNVESTSIRGKTYVVIGEKKYTPFSVPFRKAMNALRHDGKNIGLLSIDGRKYVLNPVLSGSGSREPLLEVVTKLNGEISKTGQRLMARVEHDWTHNTVEKERVEQNGRSGVFLSTHGILNATKIANLRKHNKDSGAIFVTAFVKPSHYISTKADSLSEALQALKKIARNKELYNVSVRPVGFMETKRNAFNSITIKKRFNNIDDLFADLKKHIGKPFEDLDAGYGLKIRVIAHARMQNDDKQIDVDFQNGNLVPAMRADAVNLTEIQNEITADIESFTQNGSGWMLKCFNGYTLQTAVFKPIKGSSYIPLPDWIASKNACINVQNTDKKCFLWASLAGIFPADKHAERVSKYEGKEKVLNISRFPVMLNDLPKIEKANPDYGWNILTTADKADKNVIAPLYLSTNKDVKQYINLLLIEDKEKSHYVYVKNLSRLLSSQESNKDHKRLYCMKCLTGFTSVDMLEKHAHICVGETAKCVCPGNDEKKEFVKFKKVIARVKAPFVAYADFEAIIKSNIHVPCSFAVIMVDDKGKTVYQKLYRGPDVKSEFIKACNAMTCIVQKYKEINKPMIITDDDNEIFKHAKHCYLCGREFLNSEIKHRDHDHATGKFLGVAHDTCNEQRNYKNFKLPLPVFLHNLKGYDANFIIQAIHEEIKANNKNIGSIDVIPENWQKYKTISALGCQFIDSFGHLPSSLEKLADVLENEKPISKETLGVNFQWLSSKGVYPYEYMDSFARFEETSLPSIDKFYSSIKGSGISKDDYEHGKEVWINTGCKTMGDYHDRYLMSDICLLADVFETYRCTSYKTYGLDPAYFITTPSFAWNAMLYMLQIELELISDVDMYKWFMSSIRGGMTTISHRYAKVDNNSKGVIRYFDANNLYAKAMSMSLPLNGFKWFYPTIEELKNLSSCRVEVDMHLPEEFHDEQGDYPMAPELLEPTQSMVSPWTKEAWGKLHSTHFKSTKKLISSLLPKSHYIVDIENLKYYMKKGWTVTKVHRGVQYNSSFWMKEWIDKNTALRTNAKSEFERDLFKLMNNSNFGKTMEDVFKHTQIDFVQNRDEAIKLASKVTFDGFHSFSEDLHAVRRRALTVNLNKPIAVGACILDLSKLHMFRFHYDVYKPNFPDCKLLMTDTDSLVYFHENESETSYNTKLHPLVKDWFDTSEEPEGSILPRVNKKIIGMFKNESAKTRILEFIGLRPKCYMMFKEDGKSIVKSKGTPKHTTKLQLDDEAYRNVLEKAGNRKTVDFHRIGAKDHKIMNMQVSKVGLSNIDDKRFILEDGITSLPFGHYKISG